MHTSFRLLLGATCLGLAACAGTAAPAKGPASATSPTPTVMTIPSPAPVASQSLGAPPVAAPMVVADATTPPATDLNGRLAAAERDIRVLSGQVSTLQQKLQIAQHSLSQTAQAFSMLDSASGPVPVAAALTPPASVTKAPAMATKKSAPVKPAKKAAAPKKAATPKAATAKAAVPAGPATLTDVRVGDYPDKTRLVIETSAPTSYKFDLDNAEKILVVDVKSSDLTASAQGTFTNSPLVAAYAAEKGSDGTTHLVVQLRAGVKVQKEQALPPGEGKGNRIVFDLVPAEMGTPAPAPAPAATPEAVTEPAAPAAAPIIVPADAAAPAAAAAPTSEPAPAPVMAPDTHAAPASHE